LGLIAVVYTGIAHLTSNGFLGIFEAVIYVVIGAIVLRVIAELVMLLFKLHDNMQQVANNAKAPAPAKRTASKKAAKNLPRRS